MTSPGWGTRGLQSLRAPPPWETQSGARFVSTPHPSPSLLPCPCTLNCTKEENQPHGGFGGFWPTSPWTCLRFPPKPALFQGKLPNVALSSYAGSRRKSLGWRAGDCTPTPACLEFSSSFQLAPGESWGLPRGHFWAGPAPLSLPSSPGGKPTRLPEPFGARQLLLPVQVCSWDNR